MKLLEKPRDPREKRRKAKRPQGLKPESSSGLHVRAEALARQRRGYPTASRTSEAHSHGAARPEQANLRLLLAR